MFEIPASARPPLAFLLTVALPLAAIGWLLLRRASRQTRRRVLAGAWLLALVATLASAALVSNRHAGMGTETARGWPRAVHARWESFDGSERRASFRVRGIVENLLFHGALATFIGALAGLAAAPRRGGGTSESPFTTPSQIARAPRKSEP